MTLVCLFDLDKPNSTYLSGEIIAGTIILKSTTDKEIRGISIRFIGKGKVKWDEFLSVIDCDESCIPAVISYKKHEVYIEDSTFLQRNGVLPAGSHTYNFNIPVPLECPSSFEGRYGSIRYEISLKIGHYYQSDNIYKKQVTIIRDVDLNLLPSSKLPAIVKSCTKTGCWPFSKGKVFYTLKVPFSAYAPGQCAKYFLHVNNQSEDDTVGYFIKFTRNISFTATSPWRDVRHLKHVLLSSYFPTICLRQTCRVIEGGFVIPNTPASTETAAMISVQYCLEIKIRLKSYNRNNRIKVPIIIGTTPISESLPRENTAINNEQEQVLPGAPKYSCDPPPSYDEIITNT